MGQREQPATRRQPGRAPEDGPSGEHRRQRLEGLLDHPELWRAGHLGRAPESLSSGFTNLDAHLPGGGWPRAGLAELLLNTAGVGELRLLLPLLRILSHEQARWIAWIDPPFVPYAPALEAAGVDIRKILLIHPRTHQEALWALERASRSGTCSLALAWLDERELQLTDTRRLQLAARQGGTLACLFRPEAAAAANSMAELRLRVTPAVSRGRVNVDLLKRRGGWPVSALEVCVDEAPTPAGIREQLSLWRSHQTSARPAEDGDTFPQPNPTGDGAPAGTPVGAPAGAPGGTPAGASAGSPTPGQSSQVVH